MESEHWARVAACAALTKAGRHLRAGAACRQAGRRSGAALRPLACITRCASQLGTRPGLRCSIACTAASSSACSLAMRSASAGSFLLRGRGGGRGRAVEEAGTAAAGWAERRAAGTLRHRC